MIEIADGVHVAVESTTARPDAERAAVRDLLRRLLAEVVPDAADTPIAARPSGAPYLPQRPDLTISLSHSNGWLAAAVGAGTVVGVDVQLPYPAPDGLLRRCCRPAAVAALSALPAGGRDLEFAWIWTAQEACVKATGSGLAGRPWTIPVEVGQRTGAWRELRWRALREHSRIPVTCAWGVRS
ncbi:MAG TPA: 4'-phosphopantetheinyl transferase superfamily protein [Actinophytocola sp.]|uniref:4'-phosphopantetheinyl transferase family protein n=1 Tax=Actinophytocola sp. TaxID=1872138 RepID=UPI002DBA9E36|nr:4'-phosphopantetheinyl transferase superfamily protein [Actinophytocola sp.]HEU5471331.1 4'-phosphopantetheinyl transferase superfamily protein [Actinophytocola sp.]